MPLILSTHLYPFQGGRLSTRESQSFSISPEPKNTQDTAEDIYETVDEEMIDETTTNNQTDIRPESTAVEDSSTHDIFNYSDWYVGMWDCTASDHSELSFYRGDLIHILSKDFDTFSWWIGELNGKVGYVPKGYLMEAYESC